MVMLWMRGYFRNNYMRAIPASGKDGMKNFINFLCTFAVLVLSTLSLAQQDADPEKLKAQASQGDGSAMNRLGSLYARGEGGLAKDYPTAFSWFLKGAQAGNRVAMFNAAAMYERGTGITKDLAEALQWYEKAAALGLKSAEEKVEKLKAQPVSDKVLGAAPQSTAAAKAPRAESGKDPASCNQTFPNGDRYEGQCKDGQRHGQGTMFYASGNKYIGNWNSGNRDGQGTFLWKSGQKYEGSFKNNKREGEGAYLYSNGRGYKGVFTDGNLELNENTKFIGTSLFVILKSMTQEGSACNIQFALVNQLEQPLGRTGNSIIGLVITKDGKKLNGENSNIGFMPRELLAFKNLMPNTGMAASKKISASCDSIQLFDNVGFFGAKAIALEGLSSTSQLTFYSNVKDVEFSVNENFNQYASEIRKMEADPVYKKQVEQKDQRDRCIKACTSPDATVMCLQRNNNNSSICSSIASSCVQGCGR